jgi:hypothetical protein
MRDEELRAELASWVHDVSSLPAPGVDVLRRRARSRLLRRVAAAGAVAVVIVAIGLSVNAGLQGGGHTSAAGHRRHSGGPVAASGTGSQLTWYPGRWFPASGLPAADAGPSVAPYLIEVNSPIYTNVASLASGAQIAQVSEPANVSYFAVAAAGDDRTFLLAATVGKDVQFYEVRVSSSGKPGTPVLVLSIPAKSVELASNQLNYLDFALSPDASMLAYTTPTGFEVVSLATGQARYWPVSGAAGNFSWASNDQTLALGWTPKSDSPQWGIRLLDTKAAGSLLQASRLVIPGIRLPINTGGAVMSPDTSKIFIPLYSGGSGNEPPTGGVVDEYSTRTGRLVMAVTPKIHVDATASNGNSPLCQVLWTDASGRQVASFCASSTAPSGTGITVDDNGHMIATSLQTPVQGEGIFPGGDATAIFGPNFAW